MLKSEVFKQGNYHQQMLQNSKPRIFCSVKVLSRLTPKPMKCILLINNPLSPEACAVLIKTVSVLEGCGFHLQVIPKLSCIISAHVLKTSFISKRSNSAHCCMIGCYIFFLHSLTVVFNVAMQT